MLHTYAVTLLRAGLSQRAHFLRDPRFFTTLLTLLLQELVSSTGMDILVSLTSAGEQS